MKHILFICSQNRLRSPTAEQVFADWPGIETASAGLNNDAEVTVGPELLGWADLIFVMEKAQRNKLTRNFQPHLADKPIICLEIPDNYDLMEPALVTLLKSRVSRYLPAKPTAVS